MTSRPHDPHVAAELAWNAGAGLSAADRARVARHLEECAECRTLAEVAGSVQAAARQISPEALLDHVHPQLLVTYCLEPERLEAETRLFVRNHLATCESCRDTAHALDQAERALAADGERAGLRQGTAALARRWRFAAVAAALAAAVAAAGGMWVLARWRQLPSPEQIAGLEQRARDVEEENAALRRDLAQAQELARSALASSHEAERLRAALAGPAANVVVATLAPVGDVMRGEAGPPVEIAVDAGAPYLTLVLVSERRTTLSALELEVLDASRRRLWLLPGIERQEPGLYTVRLPAADVPPGVLTLRILGHRPGSEERVEIESYRLRVERPDP